MKHTPTYSKVLFGSFIFYFVFFEHNRDFMDIFEIFINISKNMGKIK